MLIPPVWEGFFSTSAPGLATGRWGGSQNGGKKHPFKPKFERFLDSHDTADTASS